MDAHTVREAGLKEIVVSSSDLGDCLCQIYLFGL